MHSSSCSCLTVEVHDFLHFAERVGSDARVFAEVVVVGHVDTQTERESVLWLVINFDAVLGRRRARQPSSVLLPVVDGLRERRDDTLENRFSPAPLPDATVREVYFRRNWQLNNQRRSFDNQPVSSNQTLFFFYFGTPLACCKENS